MGAIGSGGYVYLSFVVPLWGLALGAPPASVGLIAGAAALLSSVLTVPAGALVDRHGARVVLIGGAMLTVLAAGFFPFAPGYWWLVPLQVAAGLGRTVAWVAAQAYLIQITPRAHLARRTTGFSVVTGGATFLAPLIGGQLIERSGFGAAFAFGAVAYAISAAGTLMLPAPTALPPTPGWNLWHVYRSAGAMLLRVGVLLLLGGTIIRLALTSIRTPFIPVYLLEIGEGPATAGLVLSAGTLAGVAATLGMGRVQERLGAGRALFLALMIGGAAMWVTGYLHNLWTIALVGLLWGTSIAITLPPLLTLVGEQTSAAERGLGTALRNTGNEWSNMLSPVVFGLVAGRTGVAEAFAIVGIALLLAATGGLLCERRLTE
ncbi:MAG TPA: MFS transporter [Chloroflexota bacterium]|nr:MFS transporter [Chloroflexota bacterium]